MILTGDCLEKLASLGDNSVDSVVTDPPYGLKFMGKKWDYDVPSVEMWREVLRVLKPGGHLLSFGGTRTYHRMVVAIEDAGFEVRDQIMWLYGSGFPKSHSIDKAIDKMHGAEREVVGSKVGKGGENLNTLSRTGFDNENAKGCGAYGKGAKQINIEIPITAPATEDAIKWQGWGTALKPANEPIVLARKPLIGTVAENVLKWGVGGLNIDESRIGNGEDRALGGLKRPNTNKEPTEFSKRIWEYGSVAERPTGGRWPANIILDECAAEMLDEQSGQLKSGAFKQKGLSANTIQPGGWQTGNRTEKDFGPANSGGASRFFYVAKASKRERNHGCEGMAARECTTKQQNSNARFEDGIAINVRPHEPKNQNHHPTVKPIKLMEYLIKLVTPPGGIVLDPFAGSGSTLVAAKGLGFEFIGIEMNEEYVEIANKRIEAV